MATERGWPIVKIAKRIKLANDERFLHYQLLFDRIKKMNDTGYSDHVVLALLKARHGRWSKLMTVDELFADMGLKS